MSLLADIVDRLTIEGELFEKQSDNSVRCIACGHRCLIRAGRRGVCQVRYNENGKLRVPWGYVAALQSDPIEKKPFYHVLPASHALTFGMLGCDYHCPGCQNWYTSQFGRDDNSNSAINLIRKITPVQMVEYAKRTGAKVVVSSYNEPLITSEWAAGIFKKAKAAGLMCAYVSNGNATPEVLEYLRPYLSAYKIDLKCMQDKNYRKLGGTLQNTLDTIKRAHEMGLWVEVVTLTIPEFNDSNEELWDAARFIAGVSKDIPWHVTAFHKDYKMTAPDNTNAQTLLRAAEIGREAGLHYVYAGNITGRVGEYENTFCSNCNQRLIARHGYVIAEYKITGSGTCPKCDTKVAGLWPANPSTVGLNGIGIPLPI
ncbi:MAG: AmmeMemoRadiSam system radical SAM enzyme [Anaerolineales bacterium]|nr:AmmeMemoRadiSam system radical SAM enzyme [Anaerolineales bacterium]